MWKKDEDPAEKPARRPEPTRGSDSPGRGTGSTERASIGRSITIRGDVTGDEDLLIQGRVEGSVDLEQHSVTVGPDGEVKASITGRIVTVEGTVKGNLTAEEQVVLRSSARVQGDIKAPRVVLEDGASFRGGVDMGDGVDPGRRGGGPPPSQAKPVPEPGKASSGSADTSTQKGKDPTDTAAGVTR
jgi:cytoskeletal protein CcmA (bactofilin family)